MVPRSVWRAPIWAYMAALALLLLIWAEWYSHSRIIAEMESVDALLEVVGLTVGFPTSFILNWVLGVIYASPTLIPFTGLSIAMASMPLNWALLQGCWNRWRMRRPKK